MRSWSFLAVFLSYRREYNFFKGSCEWPYFDAVYYGKKIVSKFGSFKIQQEITKIWKNARGQGHISDMVGRYV